ELEMIERSFQFQGAAPHIFARGRNIDLDVRINKLCRFRCNLRSNLHLACHDRALRLFPARKKAAPDEQLIKARFFRHSDGVLSSLANVNMPHSSALISAINFSIDATSSAEARRRWYLRKRISFNVNKSSSTGRS